MLLAKHLGLRKALIVLDDAYVSQLELLLPQQGGLWKFHPESIVVITSRDRHALEQHGVFVFRVDLLPDELAVQLFAAHAFPAGRQAKAFDSLAPEIIKRCGGLPLTLKVCTLIWQTPASACSNALRMRQICCVCLTRMLL